MKQSWWKKSIIEYGITLLIGIIIFLAFYGITPLNVTNDAWIMAEYDESDIIQHYAGWVQFRSCEWSFPLGFIESMAEGTGTMLSFTDSIPILAIFFKILSPILPETFQYFGWYILLCFVLQAVFAYKLIQRKTDYLPVCYLGVVLMVLSPIMIERSFRHTALGSHWFILAALYIYLESRDAREKGKVSFPVGYIILNVLSVLIHPYFLPMVMIFTVLTIVENFIKYRNWVKSFLYIVMNVGLAYGAGWLIGALGWGIESSRFGYGYFSMNLNAPVNPSSLGGYQWSRILPVLQQTGGNYDSFNYFGLGAIILIIIGIILGIKTFLVSKEKKKQILENVFLIFAMLFLTAFAITNVVTFNENILFEIPIPEWLYWKCGIFRASGRMFYPVYYGLILFAIYQVINRRKEFAMIIIAACTCIQAADLSAVMVEKHQMMKENSTYASIVSDEELQELLVGHEKISLTGVWDIVEMRRISVLAGKNGMKTSYSVANSGNYAEAEMLLEKELEELKDGNIDENIIYVTQDLEIFKSWLEITKEDDITKYSCNDYYYIIPKLD